MLIVKEEISRQNTPLKIKKKTIIICETGSDIIKNKNSDKVQIIIDKI